MVGGKGGRVVLGGARLIVTVTLRVPGDLFRNWFLWEEKENFYLVGSFDLAIGWASATNREFTVQQAQLSAYHGLGTAVGPFVTQKIVFYSLELGFNYGKRTELYLLLS